MLKRFLFFAFSFILFSSCTPNESSNEGIPYFKFTKEDKFRLVKPEKIGNTIKYRNQSNEVREFHVDCCSIVKDSYGFSSFWGASYSIYFYFDTQKTELSYNDENGFINYRIFLQTFPQSNTNSENPTKPKFSGYLDFSLYNKDCEGSFIDCGTENLNGYYSSETMEFNNEKYYNVIIFNSGNNSVVPTLNEYNGYNHTVNKIYYSYDYGIIGFDEVDGTQWRRFE